MDSTLADAGALAALLDGSDQWHDWALGIYGQLIPPLFTCEAVLAEAFHLLEDLPPSLAAFRRMLDEEVILVNFSYPREANAVLRLWEKYADVPMDFADACLIRMAELRSATRVWTVDSDFRVYRRHGRQLIPLLFPTE